MSPEPKELAGSAAWHLYDWDADYRNASLLHLAEADYRYASFLDERIATPDKQTRGVPVAELQAALGNPPHDRPDPHLIFHLGHCGSTLLSRALAASPDVLPVREPLTFRRLASSRLTGDSPSRTDGMLDLALSAHARTFSSGQQAMVKATSTCNALIGPILDARSESRALLLYVSLGTYLAGMLGKLTPPGDLAGHAAIRMADWRTIPGAPDVSVQSGNPAQLAVLAWLTGMRHLTAAAERSPARARLLDFEVFLADPEIHLATTAAFFGLDDESAAILSAWPDISTDYSKQPGQAYSTFNRRKTLQRGRITRSTEILAGLSWAEQLMAGVEALKPCAPYLHGP